MADLRLDTSDGAFADRSGRFAIVPGHPEHSMVFKRISSGLMPPPDSGKTLSKAEIAAVRQWITEGAKYGKLWSFEPLPKSVAVPAVGSKWPNGDIDRFVLARLQQAHLSPSRPSSRLRWLRRVSYDVTGLPPTPNEIRDFVDDRTSTAYDKVVSRLLNNPHFGERMAVDWLDAARYSDSYGYQSDLLASNWPYRDWVIGAFNKNLPYDKFLTYQLAGDLLPNATREQKLATAFNRLHRQSNEGGSIPLEFKTEYAADRVATYGTAMLGLTLGCARCHDHKFDPIYQRDYYQLFGYFNSINEFGLLLSSEIVPPPSLLLPTPQEERELQRLTRASEASKKELAQVVASSKDRFEGWLKGSPAVPELPNLEARFSFDRFADGKYTNLVGGKPFAVKIGDLALAETTLGRTNVHAVVLDGENGVVVKGLAAKERWEPFTWSFWIQDPQSAKTPVILLHRTGGTDVGFCGFDLSLDHGHLIARVMRSAPGNSITVRTQASVPPNRWTHVVWSWDGSGDASGMGLSLNGQQVPLEVENNRLWKPINAYGDLGPSGGDWCFGQRFRDLGFKGGKLADVAYFDRAISPLEAAQLFDGSALSVALTDPSHHMGQLQAYFASALDKEVQTARGKVLACQKDLANYEDKILEISVMEDTSKPVPSYILARGQYDAPRNAKTLVHRDAPKNLPPLFDDGPRGRANNRLALAQWTVRRDNPLTARVAVNRIWQMMFGVGLVETSENFGVQGARPSNPELLDYLALDFVNSGWNVKRLVKRIVLSATYEQDSRQSRDLQRKDPQNRLLARGPSFRLSAEMLRDTVLQSAGLLVDQVGGPPVNPYQPAGIWTENNTMTPGFVQSKGAGLYRRSIYSTWKRTTPVPSILLFDATSREACSVRRPTTNTPLQALVLLNDVQFVEASRMLAQRVASKERTLSGRIGKAFELLASRPPDPKEVGILTDLYSDQLKSFEADPKSAAKLIRQGDSKVDASIPPAELAAMTVMVQTIMNSDAVVWRR